MPYNDLAVIKAINHSCVNVNTHTGFYYSFCSVRTLENDLFDNCIMKL